MFSVLLYGELSVSFLCMMSTAKESLSDDVMMCCASCGISAIDDVKLKDCDGGCDLVKYCSDDCQENHREQHEEEESKKRLRDRDLFTHYAARRKPFGRVPDLLLASAHQCEQHVHAMLQQKDLHGMSLCQ